MFYADQVGARQVSERLEEFAARTGEESLKPALLLHRLAEEGRGFAALAPAANQA